MDSERCPHERTRAELDPSCARYLVACLDCGMVEPMPCDERRHGNLPERWLRTVGCQHDPSPGGGTVREANSVRFVGQPRPMIARCPRCGFSRGFRDERGPDAAWRSGPLARVIAQYYGEPTPAPTERWPPALPPAR